MLDLFPMSDRVRDLHARVSRFQRETIEPAEAEYFAHIAQPGQRWTIPPVIERLKAQAQASGLWNLFLPGPTQSSSLGLRPGTSRPSMASGALGLLPGAGLSNLDYAPLAEVMGRSLLAPEVYNCSAPDTGNMEVLLHYGSAAQKAALARAAAGRHDPLRVRDDRTRCRQSDATNIATRIARDGDHYLVDGRKWWTTGAMDPRCAVFIVMGVTNPDAEPHRRHGDDPGAARYARREDRAPAHRVRL